jgi:hypothetical protein
MDQVRSPVIVGLTLFEFSTRQGGCTQKRAQSEVF